MKRTSQMYRQTINTVKPFWDIVIFKTRLARIVNLFVWDEKKRTLELHIVVPVVSLFRSFKTCFNPISTGLFCLVVALGGGVFHPPPSITPLSLKLDCSNFVQSYFEIG